MKPLRSLILGTIALTFGTLAVSHAHAQADLTFSGGNGAPLTLELDAPVTYTVTAAAPANTAPGFLFQGVGDLFGGSFPAITGNITFQINGGTPLTLDTANSGVSADAINAPDVYLFGSTSLPGVAAGDVVTLSAGTETTTTNVTAAAPAAGSFTTFILEGGGGTDISTNGVAVPEPSTWALLGVGAVGMGIVTLCRRRAHA